MKKYEFILDDSIVVNGHKLFRIKALRQLRPSGYPWLGEREPEKDCCVEIGDIGGYIEDDGNLSHYGHCWVHEHAKVYGGAKVLGDSNVDGDDFEETLIYGNAIISGLSRIYNSIIFGDAVIVNCEVTCSTVFENVVLVDGLKEVHYKTVYRGRYTNEKSKVGDSYE
jgi:NDP-sugar pyrophosphorylase family protein